MNQKMLAHDDFQAKSKEARKSIIEGCCCLNRKAFLPFFYFVLSLHFLPIQYGCNSVGCLLSAFLLLYTNVSN